MFEPPLSRDPDCPAGCRDDSGERHNWHLLTCETHGCECFAPPVPGIYIEEAP